MAFQISLGEVDKARAVAEQALQRINYRYMMPMKKSFIYLGSHYSTDLINSAAFKFKCSTLDWVWILLSYLYASFFSIRIVTGPDLSAASACRWFQLVLPTLLSFMHTLSGFQKREGLWTTKHEGFLAWQMAKCLIRTAYSFWQSWTWSSNFVASAQKCVLPLCNTQAWALLAGRNERSSTFGRPDWTWKCNMARHQKRLSWKLSSVLSPTLTRKRCTWHLSQF